MASLLRSSFCVMALLGLAACANEHAPVAQTSPCPPFAAYPSDIHANDASPYDGCSNRVNLEEMLADKHDLVAGRKLGPADGAREAKAVQDYKEGRTKTSTGNGTSTGAALLLQGASTMGSAQ